MANLPTNLPDELLGSLFRTMQIIRQTEEELARSHQRGLVHGACHTYVGEEAIATGVCAHRQSTRRVRWRRRDRRRLLSLPVQEAYPPRVSV